MSEINTIAVRKIIHVDMDCFYAAVEMRDNPEYQNVPLAVGGDSPRSVLCTCNYLAREYGVRSAMPAIKAKQLCPNLVIVNGRMSVYKEISSQIRAIFKRYTSIIEPLSLDEAYLDVTDVKLFNGSATLIAQKIREDIFNELKLTASAGIAPNKFIAKIASDENKPNGQCVVSPSKVQAFVENLPLKKIPGIGPKTSAKLASHGYVTCADVRNSSIEKLTPLVGKFAQALHERSFGEDNRQVETDRIRKSLAIETTFQQDIASYAQCSSVVDTLIPKLQLRLANIENKKISKQGVKLKFADFTQTTVELTIKEFNHNLFYQLLETAIQRGDNKKIRLIGLTLAFKTEETAVAIAQSKQLALPF
jgi:DNA polymerase-4